MRRTALLVTAGLAGLAVSCSSPPPRAPAPAGAAAASPNAGPTSDASPPTAPPPTAPAPTRTATAAHPPPPITGGLAISYASADVVQPQPPAGSCHARGAAPDTLPDPRCTPGALSPAVTQANIGSTICSSGYTSTVRPPESVTEPEKLASLSAYGDPDDPSAYEYDHLVPLELGGAANDPRNLWPEPGAAPNDKDALENRLNELVCGGALSLATAQRDIATNWVLAYREYVGPTAPASSGSTAPAPTSTHSSTGLGCAASMSNGSPPQYSTTDVIVHTAPGADVVTVAHYRTKETQHQGVADSGGTAEIPYYISGATVGYTVVVEVTVSSAGRSAGCSTSFTPR